MKSTLFKPTFVNAVHFIPLGVVHHDDSLPGDEFDVNCALCHRQSPSMTITSKRAVPEATTDFWTDSTHASRAASGTRRRCTLAGFEGRSIRNIRSLPQARRRGRRAPPARAWTGRRSIRARGDCGNGDPNEGDRGVRAQRKGSAGACNRTAVKTAAEVAARDTREERGEQRRRRRRSGSPNQRGVNHLV
jgi:hypothetical protein